MRPLGAEPYIRTAGTHRGPDTPSKAKKGRVPPFTCRSVCQQNLSKLELAWPTTAAHCQEETPTHRLGRERNGKGHDQTLPVLAKW